MVISTTFQLLKLVKLVELEPTMINKVCQYAKIVLLVTAIQFQVNLFVNHAMVENIKMVLVLLLASHVPWVLPTMPVV